MSLSKLFAAFVLAVVFATVGCEAKACDRQPGGAGVGPTFSVVQPVVQAQRFAYVRAPQAVVVNQPVYAQAFAQPAQLRVRRTPVRSAFVAVTTRPVRQQAVVAAPQRVVRQRVVVGY